MKADLLREKFLTFFKSKKHKIIESDSLVPKDDPTVLFTPAGMNQFKKQFLGQVSSFTRAVTSQRCLRTDDLDKVGKTPGHHTFFEMLGNFSFGDYFKKEAIAWAWEFLSEELKITQEKLWVSVYQDDQEAYLIWKDKIKVAPEKIIKLGDKENFWPSQAKQKGPNGPCGPCSEVFFDLGKDIGCGSPNCDPSCDCGRFVEVWNLVFTQFNRKKNGALEPLPKKNIDTGMGLERLTAVMQGAKNNFETDLFQPIIKEIAASCKPEARSQKELTYAVADHIRAITFAIYDGALPSNEARGYVVRKLIRKSALHLKALGIKRPFLYKLAPVLSEIMKQPYPQLDTRRENISEIILAEEKNFISTLDSSENLFEEIGFISSDSFGTAHKAFQLYDTYGIPYDLTKEWLDKKGIPISEEIFQQDLLEQKTRSKSQSAMKGDVFSLKDLHLDLKETKFLGYKDYQTKAKILKIIKDNQEVKKINKADKATIILDKTVFYGESGGQVGDTGTLSKGKNIFAVLDAKNADKIILHTGEVKEGSFKIGDELLSSVDLERRFDIARNHTATHLLQAALRKILGSHIQQQGSLVAADRLRFDFTHFKNISPEDLSRIEQIVNKYILDNHPLGVKEMALANARKTGALAFFGEKYENKVRVVSVSDVSCELCGGTHLEYTGEIGIFRITQESSIASGIRRIEAVTGKQAYKIIKKEENTLRQVAGLLNVTTERIPQELQKKISRVKELEKQLNLKRMDIARSSIEAIIEKGEPVNNIKVITELIDSVDMNLLRKTMDLIKEKTANSVIALGTNNAGRALLVMGLTPDLCQKGLDASRLINDTAKIIGGSGGGRKDFAQAGGVNPEKFARAFEELKNTIRKIK